ncbi:hypothetical protein [Bacillus mycoides]|uniref:hypothetical protein n=1 Tax=Bacillus mycoides TaxID=1405 RepID=UPI002DFFECA8|nr:hypothetical protein [Bacillus mycoides]MEC5266342.1 hypothetical protein [Bacillus mycoides]
MGQKQLIDEKTIRPYVIEALQDYRVLKVKYQNRQERTGHCRIFNTQKLRALYSVLFLLNKMDI